MKAIRVHEFGEPGNLKLETLPDSSAANAQVVVALRAIGVNPVDTYIRTGKHAVKPELPYTPGTDGAGIIESVGPGVTKWKPGDRVYIAGTVAGHSFGSYASHALCKADWVYRLPDRVSFQQGAALTVAYGTAYRALFHRAQVRPGETVFVHGATGGVGIAAVQLARAAGVRVIGSGGTAPGRAALLAQGASHALDHTSAGYLDELARLTGGTGPDVIIEMLANVNLDNDLKAIAKYGRVVIVGNRGRIEIDPRQTMPKEAAILGMNLWAGREGSLAEAHAAIIAGLETGALNPLVAMEMPLMDAPRAHEEVMKSGKVGKIVLIP